MSTYSIKDLERISNVKAHTIRMWEQRYNLLSPARTDTNIRYYDDKDLKRLLNICTLITNAGEKVSRLSHMSDKEIAEKVGQLLSAQQTEGNARQQAVISQLLIAISSYDEILFDKIYSNAVRRLGLKQTFLNVIYPMLVRIGLLWSKDEIMPAQEHFFSNLICRKLYAAIDSLPVPTTGKQTWLLFLHQEEDHQIGLLFANYLLRQSGVRVIYLGARVPFENLENVIANCKPTHALTFFVRNQPPERIREMLGRFDKAFKRVKFFASGRTEMINEEIMPRRFKIIRTPEDLQSAIHTRQSYHA